MKVPENNTHNNYYEPNSDINEISNSNDESTNNIGISEPIQVSCKIDESRTCMTPEPDNKMMNKFKTITDMSVVMKSNTKNNIRLTTFCGKSNSGKNTENCLHNDDEATSTNLLRNKLQRFSQTPSVFSVSPFSTVSRINTKSEQRQTEKECLLNSINNILLDKKEESNHKTPESAHTKPPLKDTQNDSERNVKFDDKHLPEIPQISLDNRNEATSSKKNNNANALKDANTIKKLEFSVKIVLITTFFLSQIGEVEEFTIDDFNSQMTKLSEEGVYEYIMSGIGVYKNFLRLADWAAEKVTTSIVLKYDEDFKIQETVSRQYEKNIHNKKCGFIDGLPVGTFVKPNAYASVKSRTLMKRIKLKASYISRLSCSKTRNQRSRKLLPSSEDAKENSKLQMVADNESLLNDDTQDTKCTKEVSDNNTKYEAENACKCDSEFSCSHECSEEYLEEDVEQNTDATTIKQDIQDIIRSNFERFRAAEETRKPEFYVYSLASKQFERFSDPEDADMLDSDCSVLVDHVGRRFFVFINDEDGDGNEIAMTAEELVEEFEFGVYKCNSYDTVLVSKDKQGEIDNDIFWDIFDCC